MRVAPAIAAASLVVASFVGVGVASGFTESVQCDNGPRDVGATSDSRQTIASDSWATTPTLPAPEGPPPLEEQFRALVTAWQAAAPPWLDPAARIAHPTFRAIVALGKPAIPLLLKQLEIDRDFWFYALREITGENPVRWWKRGNVDAMSRAWIAWGRKRGASA